MADPVWVFVFTVLLSVVGWWLGARVGRVGGPWHWLVVVGMLVMLIGWAVLQRRPDWGLQVLPIWVLSRLEGVGGVPLFMVMCGVAWARCGGIRERRLVGGAAVFACVYLVHGGLWMLQPTASWALAETVQGDDTRQSQDWSCVPAASAQALTMLGHPVSEAAMAERVSARPGVGSTVLRAVDGLRAELAGTRYGVELLYLDMEELQRAAMPALTPLRFQATQRHMVTLVRVTATGVLLDDPEQGRVYYTAGEFEEVYDGRVIVFVPRVD
ncbi:MAG: cysteine peptidase family C39 domain-containing protein [Planctomycetota bacterium]